MTDDELIKWAKREAIMTERSIRRGRRDYIYKASLGRKRKKAAINSPKRAKLKPRKRAISAPPEDAQRTDHEWRMAAINDLVEANLQRNNETASY